MKNIRKAYLVTRNTNKTENTPFIKVTGRKTKPNLIAFTYA